MPSSTKPGTIEAPPAINSLSATQWTRPDYQPPVPSLQFLFHLECDMEDFHHIGQGPFGNRSTVVVSNPLLRSLDVQTSLTLSQFKGGRFEGPRMRGTILPGGGGTIQPYPANCRYHWSSLTNALAARLGDRPGPRRNPDRAPQHPI